MARRLFVVGKMEYTLHTGLVFGRDIQNIGLMYQIPSGKIAISRLQAKIAETGIELLQDSRRHLTRSLERRGIGQEEVQQVITQIEEKLGSEHR